MYEDSVNNYSMSNITGHLQHNTSLPTTSELERSATDIGLQPVNTEKRPSPRTKITKGITEETKAFCLVPLQDGWTREIRLRVTSELRRADIYYFAPDGTRFRSNQEISKFLEKNNITKYTTKNFSFYYEPLGGECAPYEVVRQSQAKGGRPRRSDCELDRNTLITIPPSMVDCEETTNPSPYTQAKRKVPKLKIKPQRRNPMDPVEHFNSSDQLYCICTDVVWGPMVKCSNERCVLKLYHLPCVGLSQVPLEHQIWYCPICRDWNSETLNPIYISNGVP